MNNIIDDQQTRIYDLLRSLGLKADRAYFYRTAYAVYLGLDNPDRLLMVTKWLYVEVGRHYGTNWRTVEHSIRTAIMAVWQVNPKALSRLAGWEVPARPTAVQFLTILINALKGEQAA